MYINTGQGTLAYQLGRNHARVRVWTPGSLLLGSSLASAALINTRDKESATSPLSTAVLFLPRHNGVGDEMSSSRFNWVTARTLGREMPRESAAAAMQHCLNARAYEALPARTGRPATGRKGGLRITTGGEEEVLLSLRIRTVQSAFNWAHSGVRSPATRRAGGGGGARGPGVGNSSALAPLLSEAAVRVSPRSTTPERRHPVQWDGTRALDIEGACPRGQAGAYQSGSLLPPRRRCGRWNE